MSIIVVHGATAAQQLAHAARLAALYDLGSIVVDLQAAPRPFPRHDALLVTDRTPVEILRLREAVRAKHGAVDALAFVPIATALRSIGEAPRSRRQTPRLSMRDHTALAYLIDKRDVATHWIAAACGFGHTTAKARTLLKRLERWGLVEGVSSSRSSNVYWWKITDAGRKAVQP